MTGISLLAALVVALAAGVVLARRRRMDAAHIAHILRWMALALVVVPAAILGPWVVDDSGAAAAFLLGVPVLAATVPLLAELSRRPGLVAAASAIGAIAMSVWQVLLMLGLGPVFVPAALVLIIATVVQLGSRSAQAA